MRLSSIELYRRMAPIYDACYGLLLQPGRTRAMSRLAPRPGERILEVGVGTGFGLAAYPRGCRIVAIDLSPQMLQRAGARLDRHRLTHVSLCLMNAMALAFANDSFDAVYAPYLINVVPDPIRACREMERVCRPGGRIVLLNHFDGVGGVGKAVDRGIGRVAAALTGVNWDLGLLEVLQHTGLEPQSVEPVNLAGVSSVVVCRRA